jgi:hypothetical protein
MATLAFPRPLSNGPLRQTSTFRMLLRRNGGSVLAAELGLGGGVVGAPAGSPKRSAIPGLAPGETTSAKFGQMTRKKR